MDLKELQGLFETEFKKLTDLIEAQQKEIKEFGGTSTKTSEAIAKAEKSVDDMSIEIKGQQEKINIVLEEQKKRMDEFEAKGNRPGFGSQGEQETPGQLFVKSDSYTDMMTRKALTSNPMAVKNLFQMKALTNVITGGTLTQSFRFPQITPPGLETLRIRDLLAVRPTGTNSIEYVVETGFTNNAAPRAAGEAAVESVLTFELKTESIKSIATWIPASREVLKDVAQLQAYIDTRLIYGLKMEEESQILYGTGISPDLTGIMTKASTYNWSQGTVGDTKLDSIRRAMTVARKAQYPVNGVVLSPEDWEEIELLKDSEKRYIWIVVTEGGIPRIWRLPVVETTSMVAGDSLVGAFNLGAMLWDREEGNIRIAEQHADFFIKGQVAILAEERAALTIFRPESFVAIDFDHAPIGS